MGVPSFFRWLIKRYPAILSKIVDNYNPEEEPINGHFDNLYLDLNGVIHSCSHADEGETEDPQLSDNERFRLIKEYIIFIVSLIRPTRLLYLAIDGVAPRAKMNQQRSRRYKSADTAKKSAESGKPARWDSNQITPGTPFMTALTSYLEREFQQCVNNSSSPLFKNLTILFSPCCSPGEGEHKIIAFLRAQRRDPTYNPNLSHCMYGGDADLILLGLGTHEPQFHILREAIPPPGLKSTPRLPGAFEKFDIVNLGVLRAYLARELLFKPPASSNNANANGGAGEEKEPKSPSLPSMEGAAPTSSPRLEPVMATLVAPTEVKSLEVPSSDESPSRSTSPAPPSPGRKKKRKDIYI